MIKEYILGDCVNKVIDCRGKTPVKMGGDWVKEGYRVISSLNVHDGSIDNQEQIRCVDEKVYAKWMLEEIHKYDCFLVSEGSLGESAIWDSNEKIVLGQRLYAIRTNNKILDSWYFAAYMQTKMFRKQLDYLSTGSTVYGISQPVLLSLKSLLPDINEQRKIGLMYKTIKQKIELNNSICTDLETVAKLIYDYWFVQFDFPDKNERPYKSSGGKMVWNEKLKRNIPDGWNISQIGDIITEAQKSTIQVNDALDYGDYPFFTSGSSILRYNDYLINGFNIFLNTGGNPDIKSYFGKTAFSTDTWCIKADKLTYYLYLYLIRIISQFEQLFFTGSGLKHLQKDVFKKQYILIPDDNTIENFNMSIEHLFKTISKNYDENINLVSLRDFLLPMLMNGQVIFKVDE